MRKEWLLVIGFLLSLTGAMACNSYPTKRVTLPEVFKINSNQQVSIWVAGEGKVMALLDIVRLRLGVEAEGSNVAEAQRKAAVVMERLWRP